MKRRVFIRIRYLLLPFEVPDLLFCSFVALISLPFGLTSMYYMKAGLNDLLNVLSSLKVYKSVKLK